MYDYDEPIYPISVISKILNVHPQTLRQYEKKRLIKPKRTPGKQRMYSQKNLDELKLILSLIKDLEINLSGVEIILQIKEEIEKLQRELNQIKRNIGFDLKKRNIVIRKDNYELVLIEDK